MIREIESQAIVAQQQIGQARTQMTAKQREMRMVHLTLDEVSTVSPNSGVYEGVGKMYVKLSLLLRRRSVRFSLHAVLDGWQGGGTE